MSEDNKVLPKGGESSNLTSSESTGKKSRRRLTADQQTAKSVDHVNTELTKVQKKRVNLARLSPAARQAIVEQQRVEQLAVATAVLGKVLVRKIQTVDKKATAADKKATEALEIGENHTVEINLLKQQVATLTEQLESKKKTEQ